MEQEQTAEIAAIQSQIQALRQERASFAVQITPLENDSSSPQAIVQLYRRQAQENAELFAQLKGIDDAIAALEALLTKKQAQLTPRQIQSIQQQQLEEAKKQAQIHAERINELAAQLATEIRSLKACADRLSPVYWQIYYKPFITGFQTISVPHVRSDGEVWTIVNRIV
jgi:HD-GYP domain-containing protein (c-di-GMP phosphodiesterase class II)